MRKPLLLLALVICGVVVMTGVVMAVAATLTPADVSQNTPFTPTLTAATADGFTFANNGRCLIWIENGSGATVYFTVTTPATYHGFDVADLYFNIGAMNRKVAGPFSTVLFNDADGNVDIALGASASVSATVMRY